MARIDYDNIDDEWLREKTIDGRSDLSNAIMGLCIVLNISIPDLKLCLQSILEDKYN